MTTLPHARDRVAMTPGSLRKALLQSVDVVVWKRPAHRRVTEWLRSQTAQIAVDVRPGVEALTVGQWLAPFTESTARQWLADDIEMLLRRCSHFIKLPMKRVQLATVATQQCPKFHVDSLGLRLLCTYVGPGTEWVREPDLDRARLGQSAPPLTEAGKIQQARPFHVIALKGRNWPGNRDHGAVHRSPAVADQTRLVLTIDLVQPR